MTLKFKESLLVLLGIAAIMITGIFILKMPISIILLIEAVFVGIIGFVKKIPYEELQQTILSSISNILVPVIILLLIGALVASWIMSGTVPALICIGLKAIDARFFLIISFLMCSITSMIIGTSWGTISTLGISFMGISNALGLAPVYTVSTIVSGAIIGDKMSPLSSSVVLAVQLTQTNSIDAMKATAITNMPAFALSAAMYLFLGIFTDNSYTSDAVNTSNLLEAISGQFNTGLLTLIPPVLLIALILFRVPTIPAFLAGITVGVLEAIFLQGHCAADVFEGLLSGYTYGTDPTVNELLNYGGINSMASILTLLIFAAAFGGIIKKLGVISCLLDKVFNNSGKKAGIITSSVIIHTICFVITGNYFATNSILAPALHSIYEKNGINRSHITSIFLDTGTGISPLVPWSPTAIFVTSTLGYASLKYCLYSPVLWLPFLIYPILGIVLDRRKNEKTV